MGRPDPMTAGLATLPPGATAAPGARPVTPHHPATDAATTAAARVDSPGYHYWLSHVLAAGGCSRPVRLAGHLHTLDPTTGTVVSSRSTETLPDGVIYTPCGDRRASVCPACAEIYRADTYHLVRAGLVGGKGMPDTVAAHPCVFVTFTAPSFGPVHSRSVDRRTGRVKPCRMRRRIQRCPHGRVLACPQRHAEDSPCLGRPLCSECYDYQAHVVWNGWAGELWRRTTIAATRALRRDHGPHVRLSFAKVAEYQARGVVHFHALIRLDGLDPADPDTVIAPPVGLSAADLDQAISRAAARTSFHTLPHPQRPDGWQLAWGDQLDIRPVAHAGELTDTAVAGYLAKYATKSTEATGHVSRRITTDTIAGYADHQTHAGTLISTCWELGANPHDVGKPDGNGRPFHPEANRPITPQRAAWSTTYGRLRRWAHMLGFGGHFATKSRRYSTTRRALKAARRDWRRHYHRPAGFHTAEHTDDETTLVVNTLSYAGIGYRTTGDEWLALAAAAQAREQRRTAKEETTTQLAS
jgi:hypothetical protein